MLIFKVITNANQLQLASDGNLTTSLTEKVNALKLQGRLNFEGEPTCFPVDLLSTDADDRAWHYVSSDAGEVWFTISSESKQWNGAKSYCEQLEPNSRFGRILNMAENQAICSHLDGNEYFFGGFTNGTRTKWFWDDSTEITWFNWKRGEPNNNGGHEIYLGVSDGHWNDEYSKDLRFLCERRCKNKNDTGIFAVIWNWTFKKFHFRPPP